jgi:large conductance mechanosensitive channel
MGLLKEFRDFAEKGNVVDLAVGVIIGAAFGSIVSSLVDDVITPLLLEPALKAAHAVDMEHLTWGTVKYGKFLSAVIKFIFIAFSVFLFVKSLNSFKKKEEAASAPPEPSSTDKLLMEIRDKLK